MARFSGKFRLEISILAAVVAFCAAPAESQQARKTCDAKYIGKLVLSPDDDGRTMTLQAPFAYQDAGCRVWKVPAGAAVDGASIPRLLWSVIGGPFEGRYRNASVIHDWYCDVRTEPWWVVHRMFYDAMITSGVGRKLANGMYLAVYLKGPRWSENAVRNARQRLADSSMIVDEQLQVLVAAARRNIATGNQQQASVLIDQAAAQMTTNAEQYMVSAAWLDLARKTNDTARAASALDGMITSAIADDVTLSQLHLDRARVASAQRDWSATLSNTRQAIQLDASNINAVVFAAELERQGVKEPAPQGEQFNPNDLEYQRLLNIVQQQDLGPDDIEKLVDTVRPRSAEEADPS